ncbi:HAMP domain-containing sensor histidine kinase [Anaerolentibacter hominis]|uniref:sensor histidine kinase n=1 Tax=Anaerolentibacter hominis TaxID=3079009 RepID=UPI0031B8A893
MKFSTKLTLCMTLLISVVFTCGGMLLISRNFSHARDNALNQSSSQHMLQSYALESNMLGYLMVGNEFTTERLVQYMEDLSGYSSERGQTAALCSVSADYIYNTLPEISEADLALLQNEAGENYLIRQVSASYYMLLSSPLKIGTNQFYFITAHDITSVFEERDRQLKEFLLLDSLIILISAVAVGILSRLLTKPIEKLTGISMQIAGGAYQERTGFTGRDEIGQLGRNFDQMADAIEQQILLLRESLQQRDDFVSSFSHELKTPMTAILGYSDILRTAVSDPNKQYQYADKIFRESKRLNILSRKLLDLMELSDEQVVFTGIDMPRFLERMSHRAAELIRPVTLNITAEPAMVTGDPALLECLITNLITNASKAGPKDGTVSISGEHFRSRYVIQVIDTGCGISKEDLARITEPFYMVDKSRARAAGGSGLGLFLSQKIAGLHDTELSFASRPGEGTTVSFSLEVTADEAARA